LPHTRSLSLPHSFTQVVNVPTAIIAALDSTTLGTSADIVFTVLGNVKAFILGFVDALSEAVDLLLLPFLVANRRSGFWARWTWRCVFDGS
jgi:hypothetical protein